MTRALAAAIVLLLALAALSASDKEQPVLIEPSAAAPLRHAADWQVCVEQHPPQLRERPRHNYDYRMGERRLDGGIV